MLKVGLPLTALALLASVFLLSLRPELREGLTFSEADLRALGSGLAITNPRFSGSSIDGDLYDFEAKSVEPRDETLDAAKIDALTGTIRFQDGLLVDLEAPVADVDMVTETILWAEGLSLVTSDGYTAEAERADMDLNAGIVRGSGGIEATGPMGNITSRQLTISGTGGIDGLREGSSVVFTGNVKLRYVPEGEIKEGN